MTKVTLENYEVLAKEVELKIDSLLLELESIIDEAQRLKEQENPDDDDPIEYGLTICGVHTFYSNYERSNSYEDY